MEAPQRPGERSFLLLVSLFVAALVCCNLIARKFVTVDLGFHTFVVSAGILPYPLTFLVTDVLSEMYGRKRANQVVLTGFAASMFVLLALAAGEYFSAIPTSPVSDDTYRDVFGPAWETILASMLAYLSAQFIDIRMFHFWKRLTNGRHLWLRNNASTIVSQLVDTTLVVGVIFVGEKSLGEIGGMIFDGWLFKTLCAAADTPFAYAIIGAMKRAGIPAAPAHQD